MANRLGESTSLYLRQHAGNPIAWRPWGDAAFIEAESRDCPVFLSIGYASCHWCHVMAHESFEDPEVARLLNERFVCVKVDREERPDVDETYMLAVQLATGRGGWPMSVFLTPARRPFLAATYIPRDARGGHPGFMELCRRVDEAWRDDRAALEGAADELAEAIVRVQGRETPASNVSQSELPDRAVAALAHEFDNRFGGFGGAPKFPPHTAIAFLLAYARRGGPSEMRATASSMAHATLTGMIVGGIHDHVGGGFHRYSTDAHWLLPHFEKMLVDNALMLSNLAEAAETDVPEAAAYRRTARRLVGWLERDLRLANGLYGTALDADSEGEEGAGYVWTEGEVVELLGDRAGPFLKAFGCEAEGNFADEATGRRTGANVLHGVLDSEPFDEDLSALLRARASRPKPALDDKAVFGWNALAMGALARAGFLEIALRLGAALEDCLGRDGGVPRIVDAVEGPSPGFLEDHAFGAQGFFRLAEASGDAKWSHLAKRIVAHMVEAFEDPQGGFNGTSKSHETLLGRPKPVFDQPAPSGNAVALECLLRSGRMESASRAVRALEGWMANAPQATEALLRAAMPLIADTGPDPNSRPVADTPVHARLEPEAWAVSGGKAKGRVVLTISAGYHVNGNQPAAKWLVPTEVSVENRPSTVRYPEDDGLGWEHEVIVEVEFEPGDGTSFELLVRCQPCTDDACLLPIDIRLAGKFQ